MTPTIVAEVSKKKYGWEAILQISDCSRVVRIDIYDPGEEQDEFDHLANLYKVDTMIDALKEFRRGLVKVRRRVHGC